MKRFEGKTVVITGASAGLGKASAIQFAKEGANLAICARRAEKLEEVANVCRGYGADVLTCLCDVLKMDQLHAFADEIEGHFGKVDILVNNAIVEDPLIPFEKQTTASLDKVVYSGLYATWIMMQRCFLMMKECGGSIINLGTRAAQGLEGFASYGAGKAAVMSLTMTAAIEWGKYNIRVNNLVPLFLSENFATTTDPARLKLKEVVENSIANASPLKRCSTVEDVVPVLMFLASDESRWVTGQSIHAEGGADIHW